MFFRTGVEGISSDIRDRRRNGLRIASSAPPALSLSKVQNSRNSLPCPLTPRTKTGMARESRGQRRRSGACWVTADVFTPSACPIICLTDRIREEGYHRRHHASSSQNGLIARGRRVGSADEKRPGLAVLVGVRCLAS